MRVHQSSRPEDKAMVEGNRCEICYGIVPEPRARHKQTKYCTECARSKKRLTTLDSWSPERKREWQRDYMRDYRKRHPRLSTKYVRRYRERSRASVSNPSYLNSVAPLLPFLVVALLISGGLDPYTDALPVLISYLETLTLKLTSFLIVAILCWRHLQRVLKD